MTSPKNSAATTSVQAAPIAADPGTAQPCNPRRPNFLPGVVVAREAGKRRLARRLVAALQLDNGIQEHLAVACGVSRSRVRDWLDPENDAAPNGVHAQLAADAGYAHWSAAVGVERTSVVADEPEGVRTARTTKELSDVLVVVTLNLVDGRRDARERGNERRELLEARAEIDRRLALLDLEDAKERSR